MATIHYVLYVFVNILEDESVNRDVKQTQVYHTHLLFILVETLSLTLGFSASNIYNGFGSDFEQQFLHNNRNHRVVSLRSLLVHLTLPHHS